MIVIVDCKKRLLLLLLLLLLLIVKKNFLGKGCDIRNNDGYWREIFHFSFPSTSSASTFLSSPPSSSSLTSSVPPHLTSAKSLVVNNKLYLIGGYSFKQPKDLVVYT